MINSSPLPGGTHSLSPSPRRSLRTVQIRTAIQAALATSALVGSGLLVGTRVSLLPVAASTNAPPYDSLFRVLLSIGTSLFLGILIVLIYSLVRFRRRVGETAEGPAIEGNLPLEIVWTAIPAVVILFVGIYSYDIYERMGGMASLDHGAMHHPASEGPSAEGRIWGGIGSTPASFGEAVETNTDPLAGSPLPVEVTAMQFAFIFHYPEGNITSGELHVPAGQPVQLRMEARDVIHAFWVPEFRLKQDVIPGQTTVLSLTATRPGTYPVICAELCGPYHGGMRTSVVVHEPDDFQDWVSRNAPATTT